MVFQCSDSSLEATGLPFTILAVLYLPPLSAQFLLLPTESPPLRSADPLPKLFPGANPALSKFFSLFSFWSSLNHFVQRKIPNIFLSATTYMPLTLSWEPFALHNMNSPFFQSCPYFFLALVLEPIQDNSFLRSPSSNSPPSINVHILS